MADDADASRLWRTLRRLNFTPMRDLVRGKLTARFDFHSQLRAAFPDPLARHLLKIVQGTGLDLSEQVRVTQELIRRFHHRVHERRPWQTVQSRLDKRRTARSIRRRYKRHRHGLRRAFDKTLVAIACSPLALIFLYLCAFVFFWFQRPTVAVDYLTQINAPALSAPQEDRAWPLYREALLALDVHSESTSELMDYGYSSYHPMWGQMTAYLREHTHELGLIREAAAKPVFGLTLGYPGHYQDEDALAIYGPDEEGVGVTRVSESDTRPEAWRSLSFDLGIPYIACTRAMAWLLTSDAYLAIEEHDGDRFCDNVEAIFGLARHAAEPQCYFNAYIANGLRYAGYEVAMDVLVDDPDAFSDQQLKRVKRLLLDQAGVSHISTQGNRIILLDALQRMYTDNGHGDGWLTPEGVWWLGDAWDGDTPVPDTRLRRLKYAALAPIGAFLLPSRKDMLRQAEARFAQFEQDLSYPLWERPDRMPELEMTCGYYLFPLHYYSPLMLTVFTGARRVYAVNDAMRMAVLFGVVIEQYRREHGDWPAALTDLPESERFIDPISGRPALYMIVDGRPVLYSVGADRDDDVGRLPLSWYLDESDENVTLAQRWDEDDPADGDWVLYPYPDTPRTRGPERMMPDEEAAYYEQYWKEHGYGGYGREDELKDQVQADQDTDAP